VGAHGRGRGEYYDYRRAIYGDITHKAILVDDAGTLLAPTEPMAQVRLVGGDPVKPDPCGPDSGASSDPCGPDSGASDRGDGGRVVATAGMAIPALVAGQFVRIKRRRDEEQRFKVERGREKSSHEVFVCERVCTSKRMLKKVRAFSKDPIPETCVTVCGVSELDACDDACTRTVCVNQHQVPNWNDVCLKRCQSECLKLSSTLM
jgi:hypothetical protein